MSLTLLCKPEKPKRSRDEVCDDPYGRSQDRPSTSKYCPELRKQQAQIRSSNIQAGIDVANHNQQLTSKNCCQHALLRMGGKCIAYMNKPFLVNTPLLLLLIYPLFLLSLSSVWKKNSACITSITLLLHCSLSIPPSLCLLLILLYFTVFFSAFAQDIRILRMHFSN